MHLRLFLLPLALLSVGLASAQQTLQDYYKAAYQSYWGAEHMVSDSSAVRRYLDAELAACDTTLMCMPDIEYLGTDYCRVSLRLVLRGTVSAEALTRAFILSAQPIAHPDGAWAQVWAEEQDRVLGLQPQLRDEALMAQLAEAAELNAPVHHSPSYRQACHPHYRVIRRELLSFLIPNL